MISAPKPLQIGLVLASALMLCAAATIWADKKRQVAHTVAQEENQVQKTRLAAALLRKSFHADNELSYSARSHTVAFMGDKGLESTAHITRAPQHLSIRFLSGSMNGMQSGYSQRWFWRQHAGHTVKPYAEVRLDANKMAARRFALLEKNYTPVFDGETTLDGRRAQIIALRPMQTSDGATGPARRLFIDSETGLTLRVESFNCALKPVMHSSLSDVDLKPRITPTTFEPPSAILASVKTRDWQGEEFGASNPAAAARESGFMPPRPTFLPPGFHLDGYGVHRCRTTETLQLAAFSRYSDGLNTLTVFAFKPVSTAIEKTMRGACDFGAGAMRSREDGGGRLMAMGDLPAETLERVLQSAKFETAK
jgi:negative regulator of sigma E activity